MKIPEPKKTPSGKWRIQVMVDGARVGRTFSTKEEAVYWAAGIKTKSAEAEAAPRALSVSAAVERYIETKNAILSPSTIAGYRRISENLMSPLSTVRLYDLTQERVQRWVNGMVKEGKAPKTVANAHGLLSAVLAEYRPGMALHTTLPQKRRADIHIPSEAETKSILAAAKGTKYELPILLAVWLGLRQSEILGLKWSDIEGNTLHIRRAIVTGEDGPVEKGTKTYAGTRDIQMPPYLVDKLTAYPHTGEHIIGISAKAVYSGFCRACEKAGVPHFRFHDLRHANASAMLAIGVPDKYSMRRMGHATNNMLKTTYQHTIKEKELEYDQKINDYFSNLMPD